MIVLDLKTVLFGLLVLLVGLAYLALITLRRRRETPLHLLGSNTADLQQTLDTAPFGLLLLDHTPDIIYANRYAQRLLPPALHAAGWQAELFADVKMVLASHSQTAPSAGNDVATVRPTHYRLLNLSSEQAVSWWIYPLQKWGLVLLHDLSDRRRLERSTHLFLSNLSHELRTPLTAILAHIEVMRTPDLPPAVQENSLNLMHQETNRIARLVQNLLTLSRLETTADPRHRPIDLLLIAEEAIADVILEAESRHISISLQADTGLARVPGDPDKLKQVLLNLLDNAVKYCRANDKITVSLRKTADPPGVTVTVQDTGPGIATNHLPHVTQRLYRARTDVEGSGLGLAIVAEILRHHNSQLEIESTSEGEETGTTARFVLPAV